MKLKIITRLIALTISQITFSAYTSTFLNAVESDPARMGWMVGSPPPKDRIIRFDDGNFFKFPAMRWSVSNFRQLMPTINISKGEPSKKLDDTEDKRIDSIEFFQSIRKRR